VLSGRGLCDELITRPEESYRLCCVVVCDLETSRIGAPYIYIYNISSLRVKELSKTAIKKLRVALIVYYFEMKFHKNSHRQLISQSRWLYQLTSAIMREMPIILCPLR